MLCFPMKSLAQQPFPTWWQSLPAGRTSRHPACSTAHRWPGRCHGSTSDGLTRSLLWTSLGCCRACTVRRLLSSIHLMNSKATCSTPVPAEKPLGVNFEVWMFGSVFPEGQPMLFDNVGHNWRPAEKGGSHGFLGFLYGFPTITCLRFCCRGHIGKCTGSTCSASHLGFLPPPPPPFPPPSPSSFSPSPGWNFFLFLRLETRQSHLKTGLAITWDCSLCSAQILTHTCALFLQFECLNLPIWHPCTWYFHFHNFIIKLKYILLRNNILGGGNWTII